MIATAIGPKNTERVSGIMARMAASIDIKVKKLKGPGLVYFPILWTPSRNCRDSAGVNVQGRGWPCSSYQRL